MHDASKGLSSIWIDLRGRNPIAQGGNWQKTSLIHPERGKNLFLLRTHSSGSPESRLTISPKRTKLISL